jgi:CoA:oxalate CoA-transferase
VPGPVGLRHPLNTPHQALPASDGWVMVAGVKDHEWALFCAKVGCDELIFDERFRTSALRTQHYAELEPLLFAAFRRRTVAEWLEELGEFCLVGPLNTVDRMVADPQVVARNMLVSLPTWTGGTLRVSNTPVKHSRTPGGATRGASRPGEHTEALLAKAGLSAEQMQALIERGVAATGAAE